jgi:hypothetical protein
MFFFVVSGMLLFEFTGVMEDRWGSELRATIQVTSKSMINNDNIAGMQQVYLHNADILRYPSN